MCAALSHHVSHLLHHCAPILPHSCILPGTLLPRFLIWSLFGREVLNARPLSSSWNHGRVLETVAGGGLSTYAPGRRLSPHYHLLGQGVRHLVHGGTLLVDILNSACLTSIYNNEYVKFSGINNKIFGKTPPLNTGRTTDSKKLIFNMRKTSWRLRISAKIVWTKVIGI